MPNQLYQNNPASPNDPTILVGAGESPPSDLYRNIGQIGTEGDMSDVYTTTPSPQAQPQEIEQIPPGIDPGFYKSAIKQIGFDPMKMNPVQDAMKEWQDKESATFNDIFKNTGMTPTTMTPDALKYWNQTREEITKELVDKYKTQYTVGKQALDFMMTQFEKYKKITSIKGEMPGGGQQYLNEFGQPTGVLATDTGERGQFVGVSPDGTGAIVFIPKTQEFKTIPFPEGQAPLPKQLSEDLKKDTAAVAGAFDIVTQLKKRWDSIKITSRLSNAAAYGKGLAGQNVDAKTYDGMRNAFLGQLSRSIAAERGVLTNQDIERIGKALPKLGLNLASVDNKEEAEAKWNEINLVIQNATKRAYERKGLNYNVEMDMGKVQPKQETQKKSKFKIIQVK